MKSKTDKILLYLKQTREIRKGCGMERRKGKKEKTKENHGGKKKGRNMTEKS